MPIGQNRSAEDDDERKQADGRADGVIPPGELEVERDVVDGDEPCRVDGRRADVQEDGVEVPQELTGEEPVAGVGEDGHALLDAEEDEEHD